MVQLNYADQSASIYEREHYLTKLKKEFNNSGIILHTCNRVEHYRGEGFISEEVANHLFQVTAGLKSSFIGETSIQGQVKAAYKEACLENTVTKSLHNLFQNALHAGKRVRNETNISKGALSYSQAALEVICRKFFSFSEVKITIVGVHNINEKIIRCLVRKGADAVFIGNRTYTKASKLAEKYNCTAFHFSDLKEMLTKTDILISATSAPHFIIHSGVFPGNRPMLILDLAVPRDVEPTIGNFPDVSLINIEEVELQVKNNLNKRKSEIHKATAIIQEEVNQFMIKQQINDYA